MSHAVVTGGSGGVGSAVVERLRAGGWTVTSLSRREGCDVSDEAQVRAAFGRIDRLDALVHCAGVLVKKSVEDMTADDWDAQVDSNLRGAFLCSREAFRLMRGHGGSIVMVSSLSGVVGAEKFPGMSAYVAAKSGLAGLTEALAVEGRPQGIRVNAVSPGPVDPETGMVINLKIVDAMLRRHFVDAVDHHHLNRDVDFMQGVIPTAENVALAAFHRLEPHLKPARLLKVRVVETENNAAEVTAE